MKHLVASARLVKMITNWWIPAAVVLLWNSILPCSAIEERGERKSQVNSTPGKHSFGPTIFSQLSLFN